MKADCGIDGKKYRQNTKHGLTLWEVDKGEGGKAVSLLCHELGKVY